MKIKQADLSQQLKQAIAPVYLISGDEPLLVQETCDAIRAACRDQGFTEREVYHIDANFNWEDILLSSNSMSLFADKKLIECRFKTTSIGDKGSKGLQSLLEDINPDTAYLVIMPKLDGAKQKSKWYKAIDKHGICLPIWPVDRSHLPGWIKNRMFQLGLQASNEAIEFLADNVEGNLLAAQQEIEKLRLLVKGDQVDLKTITAITSNSSRYTVFNLTDRCLAGDRKSALRTLAGLQSEGTDATVILWALTRELRLLHKLQTAQQQGQPLNQVLRAERVFDSRQAIVKQALQRNPLPKIEKLLRKSRTIDQSIKGLKKENPWLLLEQLSLNLAS